ncbi:protein spaetzle-like [Anthonomus grandis grandis]|uniref:protein spaetzle-like n=1 Tax=Anthonomus grandis grandis TaxID=2921223 RepID=UPI002165D95B|nr:protein spaetzle-like [Anthonomus grandis grandis]
MFVICVIVISIHQVAARPQGILFDKFVGHHKEPQSNNTSLWTSEISDQIHFPDEFKDFDVRSRTVVPKCDSKLPICENVESYPYNYLKKVLEKNTLFKAFFGNEELPKDDISERAGEGENFVCRTVTKTIFPKVGQNKDNKWKFIINQGEQDGFLQGVRIEICKNLDGACDIPGNSLEQFGYQTFCKQKYFYKRLLSLGNNGIPVPDTFKIPSACCCAYKRNLDFLANFGSRMSPVK